MGVYNFFFIAVSCVFVIVLFVFALYKFILCNPEKRQFDFEETNEFNMETVMLVLSSSASTLKDLEGVMERLFASYDSINPNKLHVRNICIALALHKNANKQIILDTQRRLSELNPSLESDIERAIKKGLDAR